jgi:hypothetical protein
LEGPEILLWAVALTIGAALLSYLTFRVRLASTFDDLSTLPLLVICVINLVVFWRARPRNRNPGQEVRLNLQ